MAVLSRMWRGRRVWLASLALLLLASQLHATDIIQTVAGGGSLEGYKPVEANLILGGAKGVAVNAAGELFVSDSGHHQVLKINPTTGLITVVAGNGTDCFYGDGLPGPAAALSFPDAIALDGAGNLFIVDAGNNRIRRVDAATSIITTVAGTGKYTGDPIPNTTPTQFEVTGDGGAAINATFSGSIGDIAIDGSGNVFVCDAGNGTVRSFTVGGNIAVVAGNPNGAGAVGGPATDFVFGWPIGVAESGGSIYIADSGNGAVYKASSGTITQVVGGGPNAINDGEKAVDVNFIDARSLTIDGSGNLLVCTGDRIYRVDVGSAAPTLLTIAGNGNTTIGDLGPATSASMSPVGVALDPSGNMFIDDSGNNRIRRVDKATGFIDTVMGTGLTGFVGDRGPQQFGILRYPNGLAYDAAGNLYIADAGDRSVRMVAPNGTITTIAGNGNQDTTGDGGLAALASLDAINDIAVAGNTLFIATNRGGGMSGIRAVDLTTKIITTYADPAATYQISNPRALTAAADGTLFVAYNRRVDKVGADKIPVGFVGQNRDTTLPSQGNGAPADTANLQRPEGLALGPNGELYIADSTMNVVRKVTADGSLISLVAGVAGYATGDTSNGNVLTLGDGGVATAGTLNRPTGVTVDAAGRVIICDTDNNLIRAVDSAGTISTVAGTVNTTTGTGDAGFSGDGDIATTALLNLPGRAVRNGTAVVFADTNNNRIRKFAPANDITAAQVAFGAKLAFSIDKKTGQMVMNKDSVQLKAGLPGAALAGITAPNLIITVDIADLHQQVQLDAKGKMPKAVMAPKTGTKTVMVNGKPKTVKVTPTVFDFTLPSGAKQPVSKFAISLKSTSGSKPVSFSFASKGTFRDELGRLGYTDVTTAKNGVPLPVRVNITLTSATTSVTFTGLADTIWKATQGKGGAAKSVKKK